MTLAPVAAEVTPHPEILYQAPDPNEGRKTQVRQWMSFGVFVPPLIVAAGVIIGFARPLGQSSARPPAEVFALLAILTGISTLLAILISALARPTPPPAITKDGILHHPWTRFGSRSPVEHRFDSQRTVKAYRVRQYTVIEFHPPSGRPTIVEVFDPDERALKIVRDAVLKSGTKMAEHAG